MLCLSVEVEKAATHGTVVDHIRLITGGVYSFPSILPCDYVSNQTSVRETHLRGPFILLKASDSLELEGRLRQASRTCEAQRLFVASAPNVKLYI
jgi:hypothetical protein